jgi:hypothetical protein
MSATGRGSAPGSGGSGRVDKEFPFAPWEHELRSVDVAIISKERWAAWNSETYHGEALCARGQELD